MIVSGLATNIVSVTDTIFISRLGHLQLGGAGNGILLYLALFLMGMGFTTGVQIIIGRRNGEGNFALIGQVFQHGLVFILLFALALFGLIKWVSAPLIEVLMHSADVVAYTQEYLDMRSWGVFFTLINLLFVAFLVGTTKTRILGFFTPVVSLLNIVLDYGLIYGKWGLPELGVAGGALASNLSEMAGTLFFLIYVLRSPVYQKYRLKATLQWSWKRLGNILNVGLPVMIQNLISLSAWFVFFVIVEHLGERELAASHIIRSIYIFIMVPIFGFADATNTLVSNLIGQGEHQRVFSLIGKATLLGAVVNVVFLVGVQLFPEAILLLYTDDLDLVTLTTPPLRVIACATFLFTAGLVVFRALSGTGNTRDAMLLEFINIAIYLFATYLLVYEFHASLAVVWSSEFLYFGLLWILSWIYLKRARWHQKRI